MPSAALTDRVRTPRLRNGLPVSYEARIHTTGMADEPKCSLRKDPFSMLRQADSAAEYGISPWSRRTRFLHWRLNVHPRNSGVQSFGPTHSYIISRTVGWL